MRMRARLAAFAVTALALVGLSISPATAHTPTISATCSQLSVTLTSYNPAGKNTVDVVIDGQSAASERFGSSYSSTFNLDPYEAHTWSVSVKAHDDKNGKKGWTFTRTGETTACELPAQPDPLIEYGHWVDSEQDCESLTVTQTRSKSVTEYVWNGTQWVKGQPVVTTQTQTRPMTDDEREACRPEQPPADVETRTVDGDVDCEDANVTTWDEQRTREYVWDGTTWTPAAWSDWSLIDGSQSTRELTADEAAVCRGEQPPTDVETRDLEGDITCESTTVDTWSEQRTREYVADGTSWVPGDWSDWSVIDGSQSVRELTADELDVCRGEQPPTPDPTFTEWEGGDPTCELPVVDHTRTRTDYGWERSADGLAWVQTSSETLETLTVSLSAAQIAECETPVPPVVDPPTVTPPTLTSPAAPPVAAPPVVTPPAQLAPPVTITQQRLPETGADEQGAALALLLLGAGALLTIGARRRSRA